VPVDLSVVVPMYNEGENIGRLLAEVRDALAASGLDWEIVCVDDGSDDGTAAQLAAARAGEPRLRPFRHARRSGQTAALATGFALARGDLIATLDGDLQNDPADIPGLIAALCGSDMVTGWRRKRHDGPVRRLSSRVANRFRDAILHDGIVDVGCSTRVFRRACLERIKLFDGMHRFLPALFMAEGFTVRQAPVNHRERAAGRSKYGVGNRLWRALRDLWAVRWMQDRTVSVAAEEIQHPAEAGAR
jgi:dolichol-phosphate mannosyltransferase